MPRVLQVYPMLHPAGERLLRRNVELVTAEEPTVDWLVREGRGAVALIARRPIRIGAVVFDALPELAILSATGSGADCFDVAEASVRGIPVIHNPGVAPGPVAEYVTSAILLLLKRLLPADRFLRAGGDWDPKDRFRGREATGQVLGLIGFGHIARDVARRAIAGLDMKVTAFSPTTPDGHFKALGVRRCSTLREVLDTQQAGIVGAQSVSMDLTLDTTDAVPLCDGSQRFFDEAR